MTIYDLTYEKLEEYLVKNDIKKYRTAQVWDWLYKKKVTSFSEMSNVSKDIIALLESNFVIDDFVISAKEKSSDGTTKLLYKLSDESLIETVLMNNEYGYSICVTTQVGCNLGCLFCASGKLKKKRNLTAGEIVNQIIKTEKSENIKVSSVVVMGIGEPFDNYENVLTFLEIANDNKGLEIGARHMTVSTCGIVPKIIEYSNFPMQVNLAISLHAANDHVRSKLMPINKSYNIERLLNAVKLYIERTNRRVTIEYILIDEVNDTTTDALMLAAILKGMNVYVNLIPYNEVKEVKYKRSKKETMDKFYDTLKKNRIQVTLRKEQGHDIDAACGQLRSQNL